MTDLDRLLRDLPPDDADGLREAWDLAATAEPPAQLDDDAVRRTERHLARLASGRPSRPPRRPDRAALASAGRTRRIAAAAAGLAVLAVAAAAWLARPVVLEAPVGERVEVALADGSTVTLNSGSSLRRPRSFGRPDEARTVRLEGEAFFAVAESPSPFVVETAAARVTVLGTAFGVRDWPDEGDAAVAVASGRVRLASAAGGSPVVLGPGDVGLVEGPTATVEGGGTAEALAWRDGDLIFKGRPLGAVLRDVERRFGTAVSVEPAALAGRRVSVALRQPASAEAVVADLAAALGLRYRARADGLHLYAPPAPRR